ncbi:hypothetical protein [Blastochloris viridis]|uniref:Uncharacterized protein n=1 Tax=Blastochloris viridis TaxID=1079 RepID=A0A0N7IUC4_BLAVI|nr:hypothetical protein [Blastochloris viridis]ALK08966.1 hypothetical protein BVIR_1177 [Blastochloris viridis]BAU59374.1 hypothetical protein BV133_3578 [Blastochloris viridis]CUU41627.1 hypothetical protein BVIRIDIS_06200 [Blastochloris viridis]
MTKELLWPSAPGSTPDVPGGTAGYVRGAAIQDQEGRIAPMVSILGAPTKFRDAFEAFDTTDRWNAVQIVGGDIVQVDGNVAGASYLVVSKDPLADGTETIIETLDRFVMPVRVAAGISMSQRINGQEFSFELVSTDDWPGAVPLVPASPVAIAAISQATTTLSVTTGTPHGLKIGEKVSTYGVSDSRLNYAVVTIATTPTPTTFTATAGPQGALPSVTAGPFAAGFVLKADPIGYARNGSSLVFEGATATSESYYVRSEGGDALPSGTIAGNHAAAFTVSTAATQLVTAAGAYAFAPAGLFEILPQLEKVTFSASPIDSVAALSALFKRTQVVPNPARDYKLRFRAKNHRSASRPAGKIVSAAKTGTTTTTITFDQPHDLTTGDQIVVYGIRDQTNFANLATPTAVASVVDALRITVALGVAATATSYGGTVIRVNGGVFAAPVTQIVQSVARTANVLTVVGNSAWAGLQHGQYVNLHGVRDATTGADLGVDGPYRVREAASTNLILEPIGTAPTGADITVTNAGGAVLPRTDFRLHFIRVMEFTRLITESIGGFARGDQMDAAPVLVTNAVSAVTVTGGVAQDAAVGNPVGIGARAANANQAAMSATGDLVHLMATMIGALVQKPYSIPEADWSYTGAAVTTTTDVVLAAAAGAGIRRYLTALQLKNTNATATEIVVKDGSTVIWRLLLPASMANADTFAFPSPLKSTANAALNFACITTGASVYVAAQGYTAP